jgi:catechol 2,3-dioxygenase-like lactoylglutathione lyase family enzyme
MEGCIFASSVDFASSRSSKGDQPDEEPTMNPQIDEVTIGVTDLERSRRFYEEGLGFALEETLALRPWDALAADLGVSPEGRGFRGFTLSYIVDDAAAVDAVLARAVRAGGLISKPPRTAVWGYSAYVTDPSGHLWKIASPKRRPLLARKRSEDAPSGPTEVALTVGVGDMKRAKEFYSERLGLPIKKDYSKFVSFDGGEGRVDLAIYKWDALAKDADVPPAGAGFRGFAMSVAASRDEDGGWFTDPDGYFWKLTTDDERTVPNARP